MPQRFVYNTSRLVVTQNHLIFIAKIFVIKVPPKNYVGQWLGNVLYRNIFQRIPERVKRFRQNGCCCNRSTLCGSYWRRTAQELDKDEDQDDLTSTVLCAWFEGYVSVNGCLVLGHIFPKWKGEEFEVCWKSSLQTRSQFCSIWECARAQMLDCGVCTRPSKTHFWWK